MKAIRFCALIFFSSAFILWSQILLAQTIDEVAVTDPTGFDPAYPPAFAELAFPSYGEIMYGHIYIAAGAGPHPTIALLHGYPGNEKNLDLAQALRRAGWNVLYFHYRGAWGSGGEFRFLNAEQDVASALALLRSDEAVEAYRIDPDRLALVGHSMGGHMTIQGFAKDPAVLCAVSIDGVNLGQTAQSILDDPETAAGWKNYTDGLGMLAGFDGTTSLNELLENRESLDLLKMIDELAGRPILFVASGPKGIDRELHITPLVDALEAASPGSTSYRVMDTDHSFSDKRIALSKLIIKWMDEHC